MQIFNHALVKITLGYMAIIGVLYQFSPFHFWLGFGLFCFGFLAYFYQKRGLFPAWVMLFGFAILNMQNHNRHFGTVKGAQCTVFQLQDKNPKPFALCSCSHQKEQFSSIVYYRPQDVLLEKNAQYLFETTFSPLEDQTLPHEFSYSQFLQAKGISYQTQIRHKTEMQQTKSANIFFRWQKKCVHWLHHQLDTHFDFEDAGLIKALCFGDKSDLNSSQLQRFRQAGLLHIIAVSGLHVGILQSIFLFVLLCLLGRTRRSVFFTKILLVVLLFAFAFLCQFTPSVVRAVVMFGILGLCFFSKRRILNIHALFLSALILLIINPMIAILMKLIPIRF